MNLLRACLGVFCEELARGGEGRGRDIVTLNEIGLEEVIRVVTTENSELDFIHTSSLTTSCFGELQYVKTTMSRA